MPSGIPVRAIACQAGTSPPFLRARRNLTPGVVRRHLVSRIVRKMAKHGVGDELCGDNAMSLGNESPSARPVLSGAEPELFVLDINATCRFFAEKLGFDVAFRYGDPPFYAQVTRDAARLNLRHVDRPVIDSALRKREDLLSAAITVDSASEIAALCEEFVRTGADFHQPLRREPWGAATFIVSDPDGNLLLFAGPAE